MRTGKRGRSRGVIGRGSLPAASLALAFLLCAGYGAFPEDGCIRVEPPVEYREDEGCAARIGALREARDLAKPLRELYKDLRVVDVHNHGADMPSLSLLRTEKEFFIDGTVLFGSISEPRAVESDAKAFNHSRNHPDSVYPFFSGIPLREERGVAIAREKYESGYLGIGEIVAASTRSPATSRLPWKALHPMDGILPGLYRLSAEYRSPVLLHIDPPNGEPIRRLEEALDENPEAIIVFGHANAYTSPSFIEGLLERHPNLWIDFFAGFTACNPESAYGLSDFVPVIERHPERFMVSTDSGYGVGLDKAFTAIYELIDLLSPATACKVAHANIDRILESEPPTDWQAARIEELSKAVGVQGVRKLSRMQANALIANLERELIIGRDMEDW